MVDRMHSAGAWGCSWVLSKEKATLILISSFSSLYEFGISNEIMN